MHFNRIGTNYKNLSPSEGQRQSISKIFGGSFSEQLQDHLGSRKSSHNSAAFDFTGVVTETVNLTKPIKKHKS